MDGGKVRAVLPTYHVTVSREDDLWVAVVADLAAGATDVEHFDDLDVEVRDIIAGLTDADPEDFDVDWQYLQGEHDFTQQLLRWSESERAVAELLAERDEARHALIESMREAKLSFREIADVMGLSHQRIAQLATADRQAS
jgi:hypothetical protein